MPEGPRGRGRGSPKKKRGGLSRSRSTASTLNDSGVSSASSLPPPPSSSSSSFSSTVATPDPPTVASPVPTKVELSEGKPGETEAEKLARLEKDVRSLVASLSGVDSNVERLQAQIETLKPVYEEAKEALSSFDSHQQKNNLVFHGIEPDKMEKDMAMEPDFCRDILETRIKMLLREHLKISRDISFFKVARVPNAPEDARGARPIIACFTNFKDRENVLRQSKCLKESQGIYITEDISDKTGEKAKERKDRRQSVLASGLKGGPAVREGQVESDYTSSASGTE